MKYMENSKAKIRTIIPYRTGIPKSILLNADQTKEMSVPLSLWRFRNEGDSAVNNQGRIEGRQ